MRYTTNQILEYVKTLSSYEDDDYDGENDQFHEFYSDGEKTVSNVEDILRDYFYNTFNMLSYPAGLDILVDFILAGALELCGGKEQVMSPAMPDYKEVIKNVFNDDSFIHSVCDKQFQALDETVWDNLWCNSWGDGRAVYYRIIDKVDTFNEPQVSLANALINRINNGSSLSVASGLLHSGYEYDCSNSWLVNPSEIPICIARLYMMLCGKENSLDHMVHENIFQADFGKTKFDRIICDAIPAQKINILTPAEKDYLSDLSLMNLSASRATAAGWLYAHKISTLLNDEGKAAVVMPTGSLTGKKEMALRQMLIENHMIEAVINLPAEKISYNHYPINYYFKTKAPLSIVILSKGNETVRAIDISSLAGTDPDNFFENTSYFRGGKYIRENVLIHELSRLLESDDIPDQATYGRILTKEDLIESGYDLNCLRYTRQDSLIADGVAFGKVIRSIRRGTSPKEGIRTENPTNYYQMGSNISEVITTIGLSNIEEPEDKLKKYCLRNGNLVITKNGVPKRAGIVEIEDHELILATDNCYIIELDTDMINPYYVAAYLNSDRGRKALDRISTGSVIKAIGVADLKELLIPCPSLEEQKPTADKYEDTLKELHLLRIREAELQESLTNIFYGEE